MSTFGKKCGPSCGHCRNCKTVQAGGSYALQCIRGNEITGTAAATCAAYSDARRPMWAIQPKG